MTATRRDTELQKTPVAVALVSGTQIEQNRLTSLEDIAHVAPSLVFISQQRGESYLSIRGTTTNNDAAGSNLGVSLFIDDVPTTGIGDNDPDLFDLASIEVLRGPQGTLFGRNVTGGAVIIHTLAPSFTPMEKAEVTYAAPSMGELRALVTGPIIPDKLAGKITMQFVDQGNYVHNATLNNETGGYTSYAVRSQLLWTPNSNLEVLLGGDYSRVTGALRPRYLLGNFQPSLFGGLIYNNDVTNDGQNSFGDETVGGGLVRVKYTLPFATLTSISGFRDVNAPIRFNELADPLKMDTITVTQRDEQFTEELHLTSPDTGRLTWITGLFFLGSRRHYDNGFQFHLLAGTPISFATPYSALNFFETPGDQHITETSYAAFGEANYSITPRLKLTVGGRYTVERKSGESVRFDTSGLSPFLDATFAHTWSAFTPKVLLSFQATDGLLLYATVARGFKSGGYDSTASNDVGLATPFSPEFVWNYEGGIKFVGWDGRFTFDAAGYYADYTNMQVQDYNQATLTTSTQNAGSAKIPGVELDSTLAPTRWLTLTGSYAYTDAYYSRFISLDRHGGSTVYSGNQIPYTARQQWDFGAEVHSTAPGLGGGEIRIGGDVSGRSKFRFHDANDEPDFINAQASLTGVVNLHAAFTSANTHWGVTVWGKNITDDRSLINISSIAVAYATLAEFFSPANNQLYIANYSEGRSFGVTVSAKF